MLVQSFSGRVFPTLLFEGLLYNINRCYDNPFILQCSIMRKAVTVVKGRLTIAFSLMMLALLIPTTAFAKSSSVSHQRTIHQYLVQHQINGIVLVNSRHQQRPLVISNRAGRNQARRVSPNQLFPIASLQKLVTGLAIMSLVNHHQLQLRTTLSEYYPTIPNGNQITVQQLMMHHSGLRDVKSQPSHVLKSERARLKFGLSSFQSTGDFSWKYADADFIMLAAIIRHVSHQSYAHYVMTHVMKPAHVRTFKAAPQVRARELPVNKDESWSDILPQVSANFGAGDYLMTPRDYWRMVMTDVLSKPRFLHQLLRVHTTPGQESYFGGVYVNDPIIHANGSYGAYNCCLWANMRTKQMLIFFANNISYQDLRNAGGDLFQLYFGYPYVKGTDQP